MRSPPVGGAALGLAADEFSPKLCGFDSANSVPASDLEKPQDLLF